MAKAARAKNEMHLLLIATDARAIYQRFKDDPSRALADLNAEDLQQALTGADATVLQKLSAAGLVRVEGSSGYLTVPRYAKVLETGLDKQVQASVSPYLQRFYPLIDDLRRAWQSAPAPRPSWEDIAHNLLVGYLLGGIGAHLLLDIMETKVMACLLEERGSLLGPWLSFLSADHEVAVTTLVGSDYPHAWEMRDLLNNRYMRQTLASLDEDNSIVIYGDPTLDLMRRLSGYARTGKGKLAVDGYSLAWPILRLEQLKAIEKTLELLTAALSLLLQTVLPPCQDYLAARTPKANPDTALVTYNLLAHHLTQSWQEADLLPPIIGPALGPLLQS
ncbi:MAG: hypothetical protein GX060_03260 [Firmicutes bacterium]|nr:hypothetical protein [Bacillota bacterium]